MLEYLSNRAQCFLEYGLYGRADDDLCKAIAMGDCDGDGNYLYYRRGENNYRAPRNYSGMVC